MLKSILSKTFKANYLLVKSVYGMEEKKSLAHSKNKWNKKTDREDVDMEDEEDKEIQMAERDVA
jgi:hypothetical protein